MPERRQVFLGNLHFDATEAIIRETCKQVGLQIGNVRVVTDRETGQPRGFAFIDLAPAEPASIAEAIRLLDGQLFFGRPCRANTVISKPPQVRSGGPRGGPPPRNRPRRSRDGDDPWTDE